jgi:hypothetical protein
MQKPSPGFFTGLFLIIVAVVITGFIGAVGLGKKVGSPGLDSFISGLLGRFLNEEQTGEVPQTTLPVNMHEIVGTWSGLSDVDGTKWRFTFEGNYAVRADSSSGYFNQGTAFVHYSLGLTDGFLRVPPGWSPLDIDIIQSSDSSHRNNKSLGAYSVHGDMLKYCFSEPGRLTRPITDISREGIRCFELTKETAGPGAAAVQPYTAPVPYTVPAPSAPHTPAGPSSAGTPAQSITGIADIIIDGVRETFLLRTDPKSETDLSAPRVITLQFQAHGAEFPAARRIELTVDATRRGRHLADGLVYLDNLFIREKISVGSETARGPAAVFLYISDSGRIFSPRSTCDVVITVPYNNTEDVLFEGSLADCVVESTGESHTINSVAFKVKGKKK